MEVLANSVVIILQYINVSNNTLYTLNLHHVICQVYLNNKREVTPYMGLLSRELCRRPQWAHLAESSTAEALREDAIPRKAYVEQLGFQRLNSYY